MKKFFSLVLTLVMVMGLTTVAWGAEDAPAPDANGVITLVAGTEYNKINLTGRSDVKKIIGNDAEVAGIYIDAGDLDGLYVENVVLTDLFHFEDGAVSNVTIVGCTFSGNARLALGMGSGSVSNVTVSGCEFNNMTNGAGAILGNTSGAIEFIGNVFDTSVKHAISLSGTVGGDIMIKGNEFTDIAEAAIRVDDTASNVVLAVQDNVADNVTYAIKAEDEPATVNNWNNEWDDAELLVAGVESAALADIGSGVTTDANGLITGGTFTTAPAAAWVAPGYVFANGAVVNNAGQFVGSNSASTSSKATYGTTLDAALANKTETVEIKAGLTASTSLKTFQTYQVFVTTTATGTVSVLPDQYVLVPTEVNADLVVVDGAKIIYLMRAPGAYTDTAKAVKVAYSAKPACGDVYVDAVADAGTYYLYKGEYYVESVGGTLFNVDGVAVYATKTNLVKTLAHTYDLDAKAVTGSKPVVTAVYCTVCKTSFAFVDGTVEDAVKAFGAGNYADTGLNGAIGNIYVRTAATVVGTVVTPSTDKTVTSAATFDAGIAMYVGMSVLAATGSAVVLKKKD